MSKSLGFSGEVLSILEQGSEHPRGFGKCSGSCRALGDPMVGF